MKYFFSFILLILPLNNLCFSQQTLFHKEAGVQLSIPLYWYYENNNNTITFYPKEKDFVVTISIYEMNKIEIIIDNLISDLSQNYTCIDLSNPQEESVNEMRGWCIYGNAKGDNQDVIIEYGLYITPKNKILEIGAIATAEIIEKYKKEIEIIEKGLKPID